MEFVGFVQVPPAHEDEVPVTVDAEVDSSLGEPPPVENVVEVIVTFQPVPDPVASLIVIGSVYVGVWSVPSRVTETLGVAVVDRDSVPAVTVAVAVTLAPSAPVAATRERTATAATAAIRFFVLERTWSP